MKHDTITITRAEYAHLNKTANAAVEHALDLLKAQRMIEDLEYQVADLKEALQEVKIKMRATESSASVFKERCEKAEEARNDLRVRVTDLETKYIRERGHRKASLKWIAGLVGAAYTLANRTGAGEEALEELEDLRDIVTETVEHMLKKED